MRTNNAYSAANFLLTSFGKAACIAVFCLHIVEAVSPEAVKKEVRSHVAPLAARALRMTNDHMFHNYIWMSGGGLAIWAFATAGEDAVAGTLPVKVNLKPEGWKNITVTPPMAETRGGYGFVVDLGTHGRQFLTSAVRTFTPVAQRIQYPKQCLEHMPAAILERLGIQAVRYGIRFITRDESRPLAASYGAVQQFIGERDFKEILFKKGLPWVFVFNGLEENPDDGTVVVVGDIAPLFGGKKTTGVLFETVRSLEELRIKRKLEKELASLPDDAADDATLVFNLDERGIFLRGPGIRCPHPFFCHFQLLHRLQYRWEVRHRLPLEQSGGQQ